MYIGAGRQAVGGGQWMVTAVGRRPPVAGGEGGRQASDGHLPMTETNARQTNTQNT